MIDLHAHFLHTLEDGPESLEEAIDLARYAVADGISHCVMAPRIDPGRYNTDRRLIEMGVDNLKLVLSRQGIPLDISAGSIVRIGADTIYMVAQEEVPFIGSYGGYDILLLEFPREEIPPGSINLIQWLMAKRIRPLIAYPELNEDIKQDIKNILPFLKEGCLLQLNAGSLTSSHGDVPLDIARQMLEFDWVFSIASAASSQLQHRPELSAARNAAAGIIGEEKASKLVEDNPAAILDNGIDTDGAEESQA